MHDESGPGGRERGEVRCCHIPTRDMPVKCDHLRPVKFACAPHNLQRAWVGDSGTHMHAWVQLAAFETHQVIDM